MSCGRGTPTIVLQGIGILLLLLASEAMADAGAVFSIHAPVEPTRVGDTVDVRVTLSGVVDVFGAGFDLQFSATGLAFLQAKEGPFLNSNHQVQTILAVTSGSLPGSLLVGLTRSDYHDGGASSEGDTLLLTLTFKVLGGDSLPLDIIQSSLIAHDGVTKIPHTALGSFIRVAEPTAIDESQVTLPRRFTVSNPYPSPFNSEVSLLCSLPNRQVLEVTVFDILGREITELFHGEVSAGDHLFHWSGRTTFGDPCGSGIYMLLISGAQQAEVRKIVLLK